MSTDILKDIQKDLQGFIDSANFEGANIVIYTNDIEFFRDNQGKIRELVNKYKKRIELRADSKLLKTQEEQLEVLKKQLNENESGVEIDIYIINKDYNVYIKN